MTTTLIVLAHPSRTSFNAAWARSSEDACRSFGDTVLVSDLYRLGFDPAERAQLYRDGTATEPYDVLKTQQAAAETGTLPRPVQGEIDKIRAADRILFHFPLWWFAPPAMLKGWCERVLVNGGLHDTGKRFDAGLFRSRSVLFCVTTGSSAAESAHNGKEGDVRMLLWPLAYTFRYLGFDVLTPRIVHGVHGYHKGEAKDALETRLGRVLADHPATLSRFDDLPRMRFNADTDFRHGRLAPDAPEHSAFIRQRV